MTWGRLLYLASGGGLEGCLYCLLERIVVLGADDLVDELTVLDEEDGGDVADTEAAGQLLVTVYIALADDGLTLVLMWGPTSWQGPHHVAQKSTTTSWPLVASCSKFWLLISSAMILSFLTCVTIILVFAL